MLQGEISPNRELLFTVDISNSDRSFEPVVVMLDTGFNGWLALPGAVIQQLGLAFDHKREAILANGITEEFNLYRATVLWHERERRIVVFESGGTSLLGMSMLWGSRVTFDALEDGRVTIEEIEQRRPSASP